MATSVRFHVSGTLLGTSKKSPAYRFTETGVSREAKDVEVPLGIFVSCDSCVQIANSWFPPVRATRGSRST